MQQDMQQDLEAAPMEQATSDCDCHLKHCLDFFACAGALRHAKKGIIYHLFMAAYAENPTLTMKIIFYARDIRGGLGERRVFRIILPLLSWTHKKSLVRNLAFIPEFGRYDDLLELLGTCCEKETIAFLKQQWDQDIFALMQKNETVSLLAKWLPSANTSNQLRVKQGRKLARAFGLTDRQYRKTLSALREKINTKAADCSRGLFPKINSNKKNPYDRMWDILTNPRYAKISA